ncbi:zinc ribbon domain-containing protein [Halorussus gelatinilyticus]|uniref:Zinc ribbon domain-containing protein n=1 Tax=Halorussus gelatinilyticus TaxID=2937524 RepID=A0A8U0IJ33_9EURY|nr:zinc ribbon domain-containing protein [Halorussus gelatinilyticus]UPW00695.1 zinc ribbon domain-containing protein [Halorussus gelatinilyticus]
MNLALRLLMACFVITAPTLLFLGLMRGLEKMRDDALLLALAERDDTPQDVSSAAAEALDKGPIRADGHGGDRGSNGADAAPVAVPTADEFTCSTCGVSNMAGARYCQGCLGELNR